ncbi:hypothetical protein D8S78_12550 [Natrialba swarupiae]|nr:hypothetical protein [Natrialba swarupiae]
MSQKHIAIYARVSTSKQNNDRQFDAIRDYIGDDEFRDAVKYADVAAARLATAPTTSAFSARYSLVQSSVSSPTKLAVSHADSLPLPSSSTCALRKAYGWRPSPTVSRRCGRR